MIRTPFVGAMIMAFAAHWAMAVEVQFIGYRGDGTGVAPDDCKPVTAWKEFAGTREVMIEGNKKAVRLPDSGSKEILENIVWKTPMPNFTESSPIVVGRKVFTLCEPGWPVDSGDAPSLLCADTDSGEILWQKPVDGFDLLAEPAQAKAKALRRQYWDQHRAFRSLQLRWNQAVEGKDQALFAKVQDEIAKADPAIAKFFTKEQAKDVNSAKRLGLFAGQGSNGLPRELRTSELPMPTWGYTTLGMTFAGPCSDGRRVYLHTGYNIAAAFDFNGNRKWLTALFGQETGRKPVKVGTPDSYCGSAPLVIGERLVLRSSGWIFGLHTETGTVIWAHQVSESTKDLKYMATVSSPVRITVGGKDYVYVIRGLIVDPVAGRILGKPLLPEMAGSAHHTPIYDLEHNMIFWGTGGHSGDKSMGDFVYGARFKPAGDGITAEIVWKYDSKADKERESIRDSTGVLYRGRLYLPGGTVLDAATGNLVQRQKWQANWASHGLVIADGRLWGAPSGPDVALSIAPIRSNGMVGAIETQYLDHQGPFGQAKLEQMAAYGTDHKKNWYHWSTSRGYPFFSGNRVFIRTFDYLYCIGDKSQPFVPSKAFEAK